MRKFYEESEIIKVRKLNVHLVKAKLSENGIENSCMFTNFIELRTFLLERKEKIPIKIRKYPSRCNKNGPN